MRPPVRAPHARPPIVCFFFFNDTAPTEIYTLSLHDALPIYPDEDVRSRALKEGVICYLRKPVDEEDRKSTRLNSSHLRISYAVFCLKKPHHWNAVVSRGGRADADAARAQGGEFQPRRLLHVRRLFRDDGVSGHRQLCAVHALRCGRFRR